MQLVTSLRWLIFVFVTVVVGSAQTAFAQSLTVVWDPSTDPSVVGYIVYAGTQSGGYTSTFDVGNATSFVYGVVPEETYFFAVASYAADGRVGPPSPEVSATIHAAWTPSADVTPPVVEITMPTSTRVADASVTIGGVAQDDVGVTAVSWVNDRGEGGPATGTDTWLAGVPIHSGRNRITVTAVDAAGNQGTATIVIRKSSSQ